MQRYEHENHHVFRLDSSILPCDFLSLPLPLQADMYADIHSIPVVSDTDAHMLINEWNDNDVEFPAMQGR